MLIDLNKKKQKERLGEEKSALNVNRCLLSFVPFVFLCVLSDFHGFDAHELLLPLPCRFLFLKETKRSELNKERWDSFV